MIIGINDKFSKLMGLFVGISQVTRCCSQDAFFAEGVTFRQFMILDAVAKKKELNMADLHQLLSVKKSTTTRLVNPLIQKGLLRRDKAQQDSRAVKLVLTKEGLRIHQKVWLHLMGFFQEVNRNIPGKNKDDVLESVKMFICAINKCVGNNSCC